MVPLGALPSRIAVPPPRRRRTRHHAWGIPASGSPPSRLDSAAGSIDTGPGQRDGAAQDVVVSASATCWPVSHPLLWAPSTVAHSSSLHASPANHSRSATGSRRTARSG